ncbi:cytochrome P450 [Aspergillus aurantiobrunneus]
MILILPWYSWLAAVVALLFSTRLLLTLQSIKALHLSQAQGRSPPVFPYWVPFVGHAVPFIQNPGAFIDGLQRRYHDKHPVSLVLGPVRGYFVSGCDAINTLLRSPRNLSPKPFIALAMENMFGTPASAMPMYRNDDSGIAPTPLPNTHVAAEHRIYYHQHKSAHRFLTGDALRRMTERFMRTLSAHIHADTAITATDADWVHLPDLYTFARTRVFTAAIHALFGPYLSLLTPGFEQDFWAYVDAVPALAMGLPRWATPRAYAARDRVFTAVKTWHRFARAHSDYRHNTPADPDWDPYWGSSWLKVRQQFGQETGCMDEDALAAEDVALLVAANANAIISATWVLLHIVSNRDLYHRLQPEFDRAMTRSDSDPSGPAQCDVTVLTSSPLLQSVYAEVLRLRVALLLNRTPTQGAAQLGPWKLERGRFIVMSTQHAARNEAAWAAHTQDGKHPVDEFWAERFLDKDGQFSVDGLGGGAWIPYGGGAFMCPGRHFAKQEMLGSVAVLLAHYELELEVPDGWIPPVNRRFYGVGAMPPAETVPFRIRRRERGMDR